MEKEFYINNELLIAEIEKRPGLYDNTLVEHNDKTKRTMNWVEVCAIMVPNWTKLTQRDKLNRTRDIQNRWRCLRDAYIKAYRARENASANKRVRRPYLYHHNMKFIIPTIKTVTKRKWFTLDDDYTETSSDPLEVTTEPKEEVFETSSDQNEELKLEETIPDYSADSHSSEPHQDSFASRDEDEDRLFLLSLLPSFRKMDHDTKLAVRIEMMQIIRQALNKNKKTT